MKFKKIRTFRKKVIKKKNYKIFSKKSIACQLIATEYSFINQKHIDIIKNTAKKILKGKGNIYFIKNCNRSITKKPLGTRIGKGKGPITTYCILIKPGDILYTLTGINQINNLKKNIENIQRKLPIKTIFFFKKNISIF